ncbi:ABC transporter substrate-binding protein [Salipaludibacillus sp. HK11]|uniref:ABC transporter substrate-binding protein n=1 Tax=Salipaludibacillus sp. HK11 TaxID=3394320 RepID=UPI0039FDB0B6
MKLLDHYEVLVNNLNEYQKATQITTPEIASMLSCSERNAKLIIGRLQEDGWIEWKAGRGRGNYSSITLVAELETLVLENAKKLASSHSIDEAIKFTKKYYLSDSFRQEWRDWLFYTLVNDNGDRKTGDRDRLLFPSYRPLPVLDPLFVNRRSENHVMRHVFSQLVTYDERSDMHVPQLAHDWSFNDSYTEWTFHLRKGVLFHDGQEMKGEDVCYSFHRHFSEFSAYHWLVRHIASNKAENKYKVVFTFNQSVRYFLHIASSLGASVIPKNSNGSIKKLPIGTGPFQVKENTEDKLVLTVFQQYFGIRPFLDEVSMYFFPQLYDNKKDVRIPENERINFYHYPYNKKMTGNFDQHTAVDRGSKLLTLNLRQGMLAQDRLLRKAIFHLLQSTKLMNELGGNRFASASRMLVESEDNVVVHDEKIAKSALEQSNYKGETLTLFSYSGAGNELDANWIQRQLTDVGIVVSINILPYEELQAVSLTDRADMLLGEQLTYESELYTYLVSFVGNHSLMANHLSKKMTEKVFSYTGSGGAENKLLQSFREIETDIVHEFGHIHLYRLKQFAIYPTYVKNIHINALGWVNYTKLWYRG